MMSSRYTSCRDNKNHKQWRRATLLFELVHQNRTAVARWVVPKSSNVERMQGWTFTAIHCERGSVLKEKGVVLSALAAASECVEQSGCERKQKNSKQCCRTSFQLGSKIGS